MSDYQQALRKLVKVCKDIIEDMEILGLDGEGYWEDMEAARQAVAKAQKLLKYREDADTILLGLAARGLVPESDYLDKLTSDDRARLMAAMNACWDRHSYDPHPVDELLKEFKERYA